MLLLRRRLGSFDLLEFINGCIFAIISTADPVGKVLLNVRFLIFIDTHDLYSSPTLSFHTHPKYAGKSQREPCIIYQMICTFRLVELVNHKVFIFEFVL